METILVPICVGRENGKHIMKHIAIPIDTPTEKVFSVSADIAYDLFLLTKKNGGVFPIVE